MLFMHPSLSTRPFVLTPCGNPLPEKEKILLCMKAGSPYVWINMPIAEGIAGTLRLMKHLHMIDSAPAPTEENKSRTELYLGTCPYGRTISGEYQLRSLDLKRPNRGYDHRPLWRVQGNRSNRPPRDDVVGLNHNPVVNAGDALLHIGMGNYENV